MAGLPLGSPELLRPAASFNLLGEPDARGLPAYLGLDEAAATAGAAVHLYGKHRVAPYRKMGHITVTGTSRKDALDKARRLQALVRAGGSEQ